MTVFTFLTWLLLIWSLGWLALPVTRRIWNRLEAAGNLPLLLPDGGLAAGRVLILWGWTLLAFWLGNVRVSSRAGGFLIYPLAGVLLYYAVRDWPALRRFVSEHRRALIVSDAVFLAVFIVFFVLRGFWPDINNGEKPMDMILVASLGHTASLPPPNGYAAGLRLTSYYYLGHYQTALLGNALGIDARWAYNLMCATLPALCYSTLAALAAALTGRLRNGLIASALLLTAGTLEPLRQWFMPPPGAPPTRWPLDYFATSRVIPNTINEYPWFTFTYADLHAHYLAMPLVLLIMSLGWALYWRREALLQERFPKILVALCGLALGALLVTNSWDFPVYALFVGCCLVSWATLKEPLPDATAAVRESAPRAAFSVRATGEQDLQSLEESAAEEAPKPRARRTSTRKAKSSADPENADETGEEITARPARRKTASGAARAPRSTAANKTTAATALPAAVQLRRPPAPLHTNPLVRAAMVTAAMSLLAALCAFPFLVGLHSEAQGPQLLEQPGSPTGAWLLLWAPIAGAWVLTLITEARNRLAVDASELTLMKRFVIVPVALWLVARIATGNDHFVLIFLVAVALWTAREAFFVRREDHIYTWLCRAALCGLLALVWSETTWAGFLGPPYHRQDTVFKFGLQGWYLLGAAAVCAALRNTPTATPEEPEWPAVMAWRFWPRLAQVVFPAMVAVCLVTTASTVLARARDFGSFEGWDTWSHLAAPERRAAAWLAKQAKDGAYLMEAEEKEGGDYSEFTRYAHATGLPGVIGPQAHTFQWGVDWETITARKEDVRAFYTVADAAQAAQILKKYGVSYVVAGALERRAYGSAAVARVEQRMRVVFQEGDGDERTTILAAQ